MLSVEISTVNFISILTLESLSSLGISILLSLLFPVIKDLCFQRNLQERSVFLSFILTAFASQILLERNRFLLQLEASILSVEEQRVNVSHHLVVSFKKVIWGESSSRIDGQGGWHCLSSLVFMEWEAGLENRKTVFLLHHLLLQLLLYSSGNCFKKWRKWRETSWTWGNYSVHSHSLPFSIFRVWDQRTIIALNFISSSFVLLLLHTIFVADVTSVTVMLV